MKISPLTAHTLRQLGLVVGSDALSLVAPDKKVARLFFI